MLAASASSRSTRATVTIGRGLAALRHQLMEFLALRRSQRVPHGEAMIDRGFLQGELRGTDFLKFAVDRGAIWLVGGKKIM